MNKLFILEVFHDILDLKKNEVAIFNIKIVLDIQYKYPQRTIIVFESSSISITKKYIIFHKTKVIDE